jgi:hypothetical protein
MSSGGKRKGAGRPKAAPTKNITFRVPIIWVSEIKKCFITYKINNYVKYNIQLL